MALIIKVNTDRNDLEYANFVFYLARYTKYVLL